MRNKPFTRRVILTKIIVTLTFGAYLINHFFAIPAMVIGNLIWLWFDTTLDAVALRRLEQRVEEMESRCCTPEN